MTSRATAPWVRDTFSLRRAKMFRTVSRQTSPVGCVWLRPAASGSLLGTITDSSGASVPSVKVVITEVNTGVSRTAETNASGNYSIPNLEPGTYNVIVEQPGFRKAVRQGVVVLVNTTVRAD